MKLDTFVAPTSGRTVAFNRSSTEPVLIRPVSLKEMRNLISEYEQTRVNEFWSETILSRSTKGKWLTGFDSNALSLLYLTQSAAQQLAGRPLRAKALWERLRKFPLHKQTELLESIRPKTLEDLKGISTSPRIAVAPDLAAMLAEAGSTAALISRLCAFLRDGGEPVYHPKRYAEFLTMLWSKGILLFPTSMRSWKSVKYEPLFNPTYSSKAGLLASIVSMKMASRSQPAYTCVCNSFASSNFETAQDLSPELIDAFEETFVSEIETLFPQEKNYSKWTAMRGSVRTGVAWMRQCFNKHNPEHIIVISRAPRKGQKQEAQRLTGRFEWLIQARPDLKSWASAFRGYIEDSGGIRHRSQTEKLNVLGDFLLFLHEPPLEPWQVTREFVLSPAEPDRITYTRYLADRYPNEDPKRKNDILGKGRAFFDWLKDQLLVQGHKAAHGFTNPIHRNDNFGARGRRSTTHRPRLENYILNIMKEILVEDDFRFSKSMGHHSVDVVENSTQKSTNVWDPSMTVCMYCLLETPLRSHQARWLDSGEFDEKIYDAKTRAQVNNSFKHAIRGRDEGALRLTRDSVGEENWLSLWVNTNKTALYDSKDIGYPVPYMSSKLEELLLMQRDWQRSYLPPMAQPLPYADYQRDTHERPRAATKLPKIAPLFRDARSPDQIQPIRYEKLKVFYTSLLAEAQNRIEAKYGRKIELVRMEGNKLKWAVDLHTLRVSGITALIEAGVPLEIVSRFVAGHHTLMMTLHYIKFAPSKLRAHLKVAYEQMVNDIDFVGSPEFQGNLEEMAPYLLGQDGAGVGAGFTALKDASGLLTINTEGICPGTSCDTGGPIISVSHGTYGPVPGGQRCGLCRYWITGPAHLHGQVAAVNNLAYKIRKKGLEVAELNDKRLDAEDTGNQREARALSDKVELLGRELAIDVNEWFARYRYAEKSMALLNDYIATKANVVGKVKKLPALTSASPGEFKLTLESVHEFALLDHITQMADFTTGFRNKEAELEKRSVLSALMMENGVRPFLLQLTEEQAHEAGNLLSSMILHQVQGQELDEVFEGHKPLADYPALSRTIEAMAEHAMSASDETPSFISSKLEKLLSGMHGLRSGASDEDEEAFA